MFSKTHGFYDAENKYCPAGSSYTDYSGTRRLPGEGFIDASGAYIPPGSSGFIDHRGAFRQFGDSFSDGSGSTVAGDASNSQARTGPNFPDFSANPWSGVAGNLNWMSSAMSAGMSWRGGADWMGGMLQWAFGMIAVGVKLGLTVGLIVVRVLYFSGRAMVWAVHVLLNSWRECSTSGRGAKYWEGLPPPPPGAVPPAGHAVSPARRRIPWTQLTQVGAALMVLTVGVAFLIFLVMPIGFAIFLENGRPPSAPRQPLLLPLAATPQPGNLTALRVTPTPWPRTTPLPQPFLRMVDSTRAEQNVHFQNMFGVRFTSSFRAGNLEGRQLNVQLIFQGPNGPIGSKDVRYRGSDGRLTVARPWTPSSADAMSGPVDLFVPYAAFDVPVGKMTRVQVTLVISEGSDVLLRNTRVEMKMRPSG